MSPISMCQAGRRVAVGAIIGLTIAVRIAHAQPPTIGGAAPRAQGTPMVSGVVYDSIMKRVIPGVSIEFVNAENLATSRVIVATADSSGRYSVRELSDGRYIAGFFHPALDTLGLAPIQRVIDVRPGNQRVDFATPSVRTVRAAICRTTSRSDSTGLLLGHVRRTDNERAAVDATVRLEWGEFVVDATGLHFFNRTATVRSGETGWFAMCGVPGNTIVHAIAASGADSSGYVEVEVPSDSLRHVSFLVGGATRVVAEVDDTTAAPATPSQPTTVLRGRARLTGTIRDQNGRSLTGAHALVWGTGLDVMTNERGEFALDSLPGGTHTLEVRVIGYVPVRRTMQLAEARPARIDVVLEKTALLSTVTVRGNAIYSRHLADFERRRLSGFGRFITADDMAKNPSGRLSDVLRGSPGVIVDYSTGRPTIRMRATGLRGNYCQPTLYVDGMRDVSGDFDIYRADDLAAVEVYNRDTIRPPEFSDLTGCGAIVVWTRQRLSRPKKKDPEARVAADRGTTLHAAPPRV